MKSRVLFRRWAREHGEPSTAVAGALRATFAAIQNGTYNLSDGAQGCPAADMSLGARAHWKPRLPFLVSRVADGDAQSGVIDDEYMVPNSVCASDPAEDIEIGDEDPTVFVSAQRIPETRFDAKLFLEVAPSELPENKFERIVVEAKAPPEPETPPPLQGGSNDEGWTIPARWPASTNYHLRQRQLRVEAAMGRREVRTHVHCAGAVAEPVNDAPETVED